MKFEEATPKELFELHAEFNQLYGMLLGAITHREVIGMNMERAEKFAAKGFPHFVAMKDEINLRMKKFEIGKF